MKKDRMTKIEFTEELARLRKRLMEVQCYLEDFIREGAERERLISTLQTRLDQYDRVETWKKDRVGFLEEDETARNCMYCRYHITKSEETKDGRVFYAFCTKYGIKDCILINDFDDCGSFKDWNDDEK